MKAISHLTHTLNFNWQNTLHYNKILRQIVTTDIWRNYYTIDKDKTCKTDGIKTIFHNRIKYYWEQFPQHLSLLSLIISYSQFCIPNQTKKISFFYKLDRIIDQFQNRICAFFIGSKCMVMALFLQIVKPFLRVHFSNLLIVSCNFLWIASIVGDLYIITKSST